MSLRLSSPLLSQSGQALISVLIASILSAIVGLSISRMVVTLGHAERGVATNLDQSETIHLIRTFTEKKSNCEQSGLVGIDVTGLFAPVPTPVPVPVTLKTSGSTTLAAGTAIGGRKILVLSLTKIESLGTAGEYLGTLTLKTDVVGKAMTNRYDSLFRIPMTLDASRRIVACGGGSVIVAPTPSPKACSAVNGTFCEEECPDGACIRVVGKLIAGPDSADSTACNGNWNQVHWSGSVSCPTGYYLLTGGVNCQVPGAAGYIAGGVMLQSLPDPSAPFKTWTADCCAGRPHSRPDNCSMCGSSGCTPTPNCDANRACGHLNACSPAGGEQWGDASSGPIYAICKKI